MTKIIELAMRFPRTWLTAGILLVVLCGAGLHKLVKNTATDAFIPEDHPSLISRDKVQNIFGLQDPLVISIQSPEQQAISSNTLNVLAELHHLMERHDNVSQVRSLVSEAHISADEYELDIKPLLTQTLSTQQQANVLIGTAMSMTPFVDTLVASNSRSVALVIELLDQQKADDTYQSIMDLIKGFDTQGQHIYVAGQGAVGGYLSQYIDADSRKMQPVVVATILLLLFLAFRQLKGLIGPLIVIVASAIGAVGTMAWLNVPYYAITSALPVVITAIAVADAIHVLTAYYELKAKETKMSHHQLVKEAMLDMAKPITLTTITTIAGFAGLALASIMPPVKYFGTFAALGVFIAWLFTMMVLPSLLLLIKLPATRIFAKREGGNRIGVGLTRLAVLSVQRPWVVGTSLVVILGVSAIGATKLKVDRAQVENFQEDEPIRIAHDHINAQYAGSAYLDILIETSSSEGLLEPEVLNEVNKLQDALEAIPAIVKTQSILDTLGVLQRELEDTQPPRFEGDGDTFAQYMLLYEASTQPSDYSDEIDNQYQHLLVRSYLNTDLFSEEKAVVEEVQAYLEQQWLLDDVKVELTGRVNLDYHWMTRLGDSHFRSIGISLALVLLFASLLFRSAFLGVLCVTPVFFAIMVVYGIMGWNGIFLEPATSMFAAIAIGVGVDFSIHFVERLQLALKTSSDVKTAIQNKFPSAARACFFNAAALASGFATLFVSQLPTLQRFGVMITLACMASFFAALLIVPLAYSRYALRQQSQKSLENSPSVS